MDHFVEIALRLREMGADSICIKDMAGLLSPYKAYDLVTALKESLDVPIQLHTHYIGGMAIAALLKAAEAGVDIIDTASVPMAFGSSQPPVETIVRALQDSDRDSGLELHKLFDIATHFEEIRKHKGFERGVTRINDMKVFEHQVPGGMISNLLSQLEEQRASHRVDEVMEEIPYVRADMGYPPLVTPTSQIIVIQAVLNVLMGERYKLCPGEVKDYVRGLYGKPPVDISDEICQKIIGDEEIITVRPADLLEPGWEKAKQEVAQWVESDEDILTYVLFPQVALKYFEWRKSKGLEDASLINTGEYLTVDMYQPEKVAVNRPVVSKPNLLRRDEEMNFEEIKELILLLDKSSLAELELHSDDFRLNLRKSVSNTRVTADTGDDDLQSSSSDPAAVIEAENMAEVTAPMVGTFFAAASPDALPFVKAGDRVTTGQTLCIVEAMKLMNEIKAEVSGMVTDVLVSNGEPVEYGQVIFVIEKD